MGMLGKVTTWIFLALACNLVIRYTLLMDWNKRVYNHSPGPCQIVEGIADGSEDIDLMEDGIALISSGLNYLNVTDLQYVKGGIYVFDFTAEKSLHPRVKEMKIASKTLNLKTFNPHGISTYTSKGRTTLYVINHRPEGDSVECFQYKKGDYTLQHIKTITDPLIYAANDLVAVGPDRFYLSNDHYFKNFILRSIETIMMLNLGNLVFYDGKKAQLLDSWLLTPNGVAMNKNQSYLYVSMPSAEQIRAYKVKLDNSIERHIDMTLMTSPDNIFVDPENGDLWTGCHPIFHEMMSHMLHPKTSRAPSQVLRVRPQAKHDSWTVTEPFADDGRLLAGSSVAVFHKDQFLVGTVQHKLLLCQAPDKDML